jgi:hypothetical protein
VDRPSPGEDCGGDDSASVDGAHSEGPTPSTEKAAVKSRTKYDANPTSYEIFQVE